MDVVSMQCTFDAVRTHLLKQSGKWSRPTKLQLPAVHKFLFRVGWKVDEWTSRGPDDCGISVLSSSSGEVLMRPIDTADHQWDGNKGTLVVAATCRVGEEQGWLGLLFQVR